MYQYLLLTLSFASGLGVFSLSLPDECLCAHDDNIDVYYNRQTIYLTLSEGDCVQTADTTPKADDWVDVVIDNRIYSIRENGLQRLSCDQHTPIGRGLHSTTRLGTHDVKRALDWNAWGECHSFGSYCAQTRTSVNLHGGNYVDQRNCSCPINGGWSEWTETSCSVTCDLGERLRSRSCSNPTPSNGGKDCDGQNLIKETCNSPCPIDGGWSVWTAWSPCSVSCDVGVTYRSRNCSNPLPQFGGAKCPEKSNEFGSCLMPDCPVDGQWGIWTHWSVCTVSCGTGNTLRTRVCDSPAQASGGKPCTGSPSESSQCSITPCPVDGGWTEWSAWSACAKTCENNSSKIRTRVCSKPVPANNGKDCNGERLEIGHCSNHSCTLGVWTEWGEPRCSVSCGSGASFRFRKCQNSTSTDHCEGESFEPIKSCTIDCQVNGSWSSWYGLGTCDVTCGNGSHVRTRNCTNPPPGALGEPCPGHSVDSTICAQTPCPVDGGWTSWSTWGGCSKTCGTGITYRNRDCSNPTPIAGGEKCNGSKTDFAICKQPQPCPIDGNWTIWTEWQHCLVSCGIGAKARVRSCDNPAPLNGGHNCTGETMSITTCKLMECSVDGGWSDWSTWEKCNGLCGNGLTNRHRNCTNPASAYGGASCSGSLEEHHTCDTGTPCPIDGNWSGWNIVSNCSETCGTGNQTRQRYCNSPVPSSGGTNCTGTDTDMISCVDNSFCPVDGDWSIWSSWAACSVTCGTGTQYKTRLCDNPKPIHGGKCPPGPEVLSQNCTMIECPVDGGWSIWSDFSTCSATCDDGNHTRSRSCNNPAPQYNGSVCVGDATETTICAITHCPVNGSWSHWYSWSECSHRCGPGTKNRGRTCTNPPPDHGGEYCPDNFQEVASCTGMLCPIDGSWSNWSTWTQCTKTCETGYESRTRMCDSPAPYYGGKNCVGNPSENATCNTQGCPVDGGWSQWNSYSACSVTCEDGDQIRSRTCTKPAPSNGGQQCAGNATFHTVCQLSPCPIDGVWGTWSAYSPCSTTCGPGNMNRTRQCDSPAPAHGGLNCRDTNTDASTCSLSECPIDGTWTEWFGWSQCSVTCGSQAGVRDRIRNCANPRPQHGGSYCVGDASENQNCSLSYSCQVPTVLHSVPTHGMSATTTNSLPTSTVPTMMPPTTAAPTTTMPPNTAALTTMPPNTAAPTTMPPNTMPPNTAAPTTMSPTTTASTTMAPTTTVPTSGFECMVCNGPSVLCETSYIPSACPNSFCVNDLTNQRDGSVTVNRRCGTLADCEDWYNNFSDEERCTTFDPFHTNYFDARCLYCCTTPRCNELLKPRDLYVHTGPLG